MIFLRVDCTTYLQIHIITKVWHFVFVIVVVADNCRVAVSHFRRHSGGGVWLVLVVEIEVEKVVVGTDDFFIEMDSLVDDAVVGDFSERTGGDGYFCVGDGEGGVDGEVPGRGQGGGGVCDGGELLCVAELDEVLEAFFWDE